jgi:ATP-dependent Clp protease ATP-binding subunit ClpA
MTSNVGSQVIAAAGGRDGARPGEPEAYEAMKRQVTEALRLQFRPEFLNRVDEVIVFHALTDADLAAIVDLLVADLQRRLASQDLALELTPAARALIAREGTDPTFGARPLKRTIQRLVENPLARALIEGRFKPGQAITADADPVGTTLLFTADGASVVADAATRRDARAQTDEAGQAVARGGSRRRRSGASILDLPDTEGAGSDDRRRDGGGRPN